MQSSKMRQKSHDDFHILHSCIYRTVMFYYYKENHIKIYFVTFRDTNSWKVLQKHTAV